MPANKKRTDQQRPRLMVRNARVKDIPAVRDLILRVYDPLGMSGYTTAMLRGQIHNFPDGQFVAIYDDKIVGYCATFIIGPEDALKPHTWREITAGGYASRHDADGDYLYGMEVCVDPEYRGLRIGQRLYTERKKLAQAWGLKGIVYGGRLPTLAKRLQRFGTAESLQ